MSVRTQHCYPGEEIRTFSLEELKNTQSEKSQNPVLTEVFFYFQSEMKTALLQMKQVISSYIKANSAEIYHHHLSVYFTDSPSFVNCNHLSCLLCCVNIFIFVRGEVLSLLWAYIGFTVLTSHLGYSLRKTCLLRIKTSFVQELCQSFQSLPILKGKYFQEGYM